MDPLEFLETAKDLAGGKREADWRSSVSRAYYAIYNLFCDIFRSNVRQRLLADAGNKRRIAHDFIVRCLKNCSDEDVVDLGDMLNDLRKQRDDADYKLGKAFAPEGANEACSNAFSLCGDIGSLSATRIGSAVMSLLTVSPFGHHPE